MWFNRTVSQITRIPLPCTNIYLPWMISLVFYRQEFLLSCTPSGIILKVCKVSSTLVHWVRRNCANKIFGQTEVPIMHIVSYFSGKAVFITLHKPTITLIITLSMSFKQQFPCKIKAHKFQMLAQTNIQDNSYIPQTNCFQGGWGIIRNNCSEWLKRV